MVTVGNVLACQTLIGFIQGKFAKSENVIDAPVRSKSAASSQRLASAALRRKSKSFMVMDMRSGSLRSGKNAANLGQGDGGVDLAVHERDLSMWQSIIGTLLRLDCNMSTQMEETGIFTSSGKRVGGPMPSAR